MGLPEHFISCDWGTTNFRLRVVETQSLRVLCEHRTGQGIKMSFEKFRKQTKLDQQQFFTHYLTLQLKKLPERFRNSIVILVGMASSNIGLCELEYAKLPIAPSGKSLLWKYMLNENGPNFLLVSGVKGENGMMRGEEVQAIGLAEQLSIFEKGILILPGTHAKHISFEKGEFISLRNFMTGELFEVIGNYSILADSISKSPWAKDKLDAFKEGLSLGFDGQMSAHLFNIRARDLLYEFPKEDNYYMLSGLLIGDELKYLKHEKSKICLAAATPMYTMYKIALEMLLVSNRPMLFDGDAIEQALLIGQRKILKLSDK